MFTLPLDDIIEEGLELDWIEETSALASYLQNFPDIDFAFEKPLDAAGRVWKVDDTIMVKGNFRTVLRLRCSRCLEEFSYPLSSAFEVALRPSGKSSFEEELELGEEDMESGFYEGEEIHLSEIACEQVFLEIPYQPLCREACKGLCPVCGKDQNRATCECPREDLETGFAVLRNLKLDE